MMEFRSKVSGGGRVGFAKQSGALSVPSFERNVPSLASYVQVCLGLPVHGRSCTIELSLPSQPPTEPPRSHTSTQWPLGWLRIAPAEKFHAEF